MRTHKLTSALASLLAFVLLIEPVLSTIPPAEAVEAESQENFAEQVVDTTSDPMLGVQNGVEDILEEQSPRTREELLALDGVTLTEDGQLASVKTSLLDSLSEEERDILLSLAPVSTYSARAAGPNEELKELFGLIDEEIEQGAHLHGDMLAFTSELSDLSINRSHMAVSDQQMEELVELIAAGYTCSQAILALAAKDALDLSLDTLKSMRMAQCEEALLATSEEGDTFEEQEADVTDYLAEKTGLPKALVAQLIASGDVTAYQIDQTMEGALDQTFPFPETTPNTDEIATLYSSDEPICYDPKEVLGKPYTYDQQGNFDVNLKDGSYTYTETDLSIPGKNGLDLVLTRQFHSDRANTTYAMGGIYPAKGTDIGQVAFTVSCRWYEANTAGGQTKLIRELTDPSKYTLQTSQYDDDLAKEVYQFRLDQYETAVDYRQTYWADLCGSIIIARDSSNKAYAVVLVPTLTCTRRMAEKYIKSFELEDTYLVDEFGLGHGWMLGISHLRMEYPSYENFDTAERQLRLTTSDGTQYYIEKRVGTTGNYIENYEGSDIEFRKCGTGEYPSAVHGLYHKDGKVEYFDKNGRNIAIVDRFGNKITLAYTYADAQENKVSTITITDTLNNTVVYENLNLDPTKYISFKGFPYNAKWRLSLNGKTIREYYIDTEIDAGTDTEPSGLWLYSTPQSDGTQKDHRTYPVKLIWVSNEAGEFTRYNGSARRTRFNCFLQPSFRNSLKWDQALFANDGYNCVVEMYQVLLPNGAKNWLEIEPSQKAFGTYGYRSYVRCHSVRSLNSADIGWDTVEYIWGDFDLLDGQRGYDQDYRTIAQYQQSYRLADANGNITSGSKSWYNHDVYYCFNFQDQLIHTEKNSYESQSLSPNQESIPQSMVTYKQQKWTSETTKYSYASEFARKPKKITTTYYNSSGEAEMTASESYIYDDKWNITSYTKPNGSKETYTYDVQYSLPLTQTVQQDSSTTIKVVNTLTPDKKNIAISDVTRNGAAVGKTAFSYNSAGQLTSQNDYLSSTDYVTTTYEYGGGALPTQVSVAGLKTATGTVAAGSPGFAAGTIARKQTYNDRGWITTQTDANGNITSYSYDAVGRITQVTNPEGTTQAYTYNVPNNTVTYTDEAGSSWLCTYGDSGKLLTVKDLTSNKVLVSYTYDHLDQLVKMVTYGGSTPDQIICYCYDTDGRLIEQSNVDAWGYDLYREFYHYEYKDGFATAKKSTDGNGYAPGVVTTSYQDNMGNVVKAGRFLNSTEYFDTFDYDYLGNQTQVRSAYSASLNDTYSTRTTYDQAGRVLTTTNIVGQTTSKTYDWMGNLLTDTDPKGNVTRYTYDTLSRLVRVVTPLDSGRTSQTDYTYDPNGNIIEERTRTGSSASSTTARVTTYEYDDLGRLILVKGNGKEDGKSGTNQFQYTQYVYDNLGNITKMYTGLHAPLTVNSSGSVTANGDSTYSVTQYAYDRYSRLVEQTDALGNKETYVYDLNGNLKSETDRRGFTTLYSYDAMGRLISSTAGTNNLRFTYTPTNQRQTATSNGATTYYTYDSLGRLISEETPYATKTFTYNIGDLRTSFKVEDDTTIYLNNTYTYDEIGRLTNVSGSGTQATYAYDTNGNLSSTAYNNDTTATYTYNSGNLPTKVENKKGTTVRSRYSYTYGLDGNQLTKTDHKSRTTTYTYDGLNRLTKEVQTGTGAFTNSYTYDDYSNRSAATLAGVAASYSYDANNRLLSTSQSKNTTAYTYDDQGNLTNSVLTYNGVEQNAVDYTYDGFNRLTNVRDNSGETVYTYDADGKRSSKQTANGAQYYIWDGDQLVAAITPSVDPFFEITLPDSGVKKDISVSITEGNTYYAKINGVVYSAVAEFDSGQAQLFKVRPGDDDPIPIIPPDPIMESYTVLEIGGVAFYISNLTGQGTIYGTAGANIQLFLTNPTSVLPTTTYIRGLSLVAAVKDGVRTYYHYNAHGDVVQLTNSSGTVTKDYTYDAFGVEKSASSTDTNPFRYCGEQFDSETGNYYLRSRFYSPGVGRFTQEDPVMDGLNWYTYCAGNPITYVDPSGTTIANDGFGYSRYTEDEKNGPTSQVIRPNKSTTEDVIAQHPNLENILQMYNVTSIDQIPDRPKNSMLFMERTVSSGWLVFGHTIVMDEDRYCEYRFVGVSASVSEIPIGTTITGGLVYNVVNPGDYAGPFGALSSDLILTATGSAYALNGVYSDIQGGEGTSGSAGVSVTWYKQVQDDWVYGLAPITWYHSPKQSVWDHILNPSNSNIV